MPYRFEASVGVTGTPSVEQAAAAVDKLDDGLDGLASVALDAGDGMDGTAKEAKKLAKQTGDLGKEAKSAQVNFGELSAEFGKMGGPIGKLGKNVFGLRDGLGKIGKNLGPLKAGLAVAAVGVGLLAVAAVAAAAALVALGAAMVKAALTSSDAANEAAILREGLTGSASAAAELSSTIRSVASAVPISVAEVGKLADGLYKAGKRGAELEEALLAASYEAAGLGENPGPELIARRMANLSVIGMKLKDNIREIFAGASTVDATTKFAKSLGGFAELFGQNHVEGRALQKLLSVIVDPLLNALAKAEPYAKEFFRGLIVGALDIAILAVRAGKALEDMLPEDMLGDMDALAVAFEVGKYAMYAFAAILVVVAIGLAVIVAALALVVASTIIAIATIGAIAAVVAAVGIAIGVAVVKAVSFLIDLGKAGVTAAKDLIDGLVGGIKSGAGAVVAAIKAMAGAAVNAIKSALKIASPSKIFEDLGGYTGEGFAIGIEGETASVQSSLEMMVTPPQTEIPSLSSAPSGGMGGSGGGASIDLSGASFVFHGVKNAESAVSMLEDALTRILEGDALAVGAG